MMRPFRQLRFSPPSASPSPHLCWTQPCNGSHTMLSKRFTIKNGIMHAKYEVVGFV